MSKIPEGPNSENKKHYPSGRTSESATWRYEASSDRLFLSDRACTLLGLEPCENQLSIEQFYRLVHPDDAERVKETYAGSVKQSADNYSVSYRIIRQNDKQVRFFYDTGVNLYDTNKKLIQTVGIVQDETDSRRVSVVHEITRQVFQLLSSKTGLRDSISSMLAILKENLELDAVGVRLQDGDDYPYYVEDGFPADFLELENSLVSRNTKGGLCRDHKGCIKLECTCGAVISGKTTTEFPVFTPGGSAWTNNSLPLLDIPKSEDPRNVPRNQCIHFGYASIALVPILAASKPVGLIQLNDKMPGRFSLAMIEALESLGNIIGEALLRKQALEKMALSEERFRSLVNSFEDIIYTLDRNQRHTGVYGKWVENQGLIPDFFLNKTSAEILGEEAAKPHSDANLRALEGETVVYEWQTQHEGNNRYFQTIVSPLHDGEGKITGVVGVGRDITDQKNARKLEQKVVLARKSLEVKQNFLANMSHEIRTPLTGVLGMADILAQTPLNPIQTEYLETLRLSGENLREIINQVLEFSKIEAGKMTLDKKEFRLENLFHNAKKLFQSLSGKNISFKTDIDRNLPQHIKADEKRINQIISNLLSNAIKFTDTGEIVLQAVLVKTPALDKHIVIKFCVSDTGRGVPEELQEKIFTPFAQVDESDTRKYEGTGLGLSICRDLVHMHGGKIGLESTPGQGSMFWFTIKAEKGCRRLLEQKERGEKQKNAIKGLRVLYAEDKIVNQKVFAIMLTSMGHKVTLAANGKQAVEVFKPGVFDIVFMDIQMPELDGIGATMQLRKRYNDQLPPIVGLSANAFEGDREKYMEQGLDDYITKPIKKDDIEKLFLKYFKTD